MRLDGPPPLTGERTVPGVAVENYWFRRHEIAYRWTVEVLPPAPSGHVVDAGCGEGYGSDVLRAAGHRVVGIDCDPATTTHARQRYGVPAAVAGLDALPVADRSCAGVVSLQVVEHLWDQPAYAAECARVLRPGGVLVVSTPNRLTFSPDWRPGQRPANGFHTVELTACDLVDLLSPYVTDLELYGVHHGPALRELDDRFVGGLVTAQLAAAPDTWPAELAAAVSAVAADDFEIRPDGPDHPLADSLDLIAVGGAAAR